MSKVFINRLIKIEERMLHDKTVEEAHQEFWNYIQYLIDNPQPNRNIHDFESEVFKKYEEIAEHTKKTCRT